MACARFIDFIARLLVRMVGSRHETLLVESRALRRRRIRACIRENDKIIVGHVAFAMHERGLMRFRVCHNTMQMLAEVIPTSA